MSEAAVGQAGIIPPSSSPASRVVTASAAPPRPAAYVPALDGLRGLAILGVLLLHFTVLTPEPTSDWPRLLWRVFKSGWIGVDLFFVLSGFLITGILLDARGGRHFFRNFYVRRTLRIFPLYYGVLVLVFLVLPQVHLAPQDAALLEAHGQWWYWTYLSNVLIALHHNSAVPFDAQHLWSLAVEEQFYLFWPFVVFACRSETLKKVCLAIIAGALLLRVGLTFTGEHRYVFTEVKYVLLPTRMDTLVMGGLLALYAREPGGLARLLPLAWKAMAIAAVPLTVLFVWEREFNAIGATMSTIGFSLLAVFFAGLLVVAVTARRESRLGRLLTSTWLMMLGRYSYALYLFHHFIRRPLWDALAPTLLAAPGVMSWPARAAFIALGIGVTLALAVVSWNVFEKHFLRLKDLFPYEPRERATVLPAP